MEKDKTLGNDGLPKKFYEVFWDNVEIPLLASINDAFIKLIEKKDRDKELLRNGDQYPYKIYEIQI